MQKTKLVKLWAWSLGCLVCWASPVLAQSVQLTSSVVVTSASQTPIEPQKVLQNLADMNVVYLGETHDRAEDHRAQLEIIQALHRKNPQMAIALEMFQRPFQPIIDRYLAGEISAQELRSQTEYDQRWGYPWEFYAPILQFAKENRLRVVALNAPSEVTRKVARGGLQQLTLSDRRYIPPTSEIRAEPNSYRERIRQIYEGFHHSKGNSAQFENFFLAQVLWDETMADRINQFLRQNPQTQLIVLAGQGHLAFGDGIPSRVLRRNHQIRQAIVLLNPDPELQAASNPPAADYFWMTQPLP